MKSLKTRHYPLIDTLKPKDAYQRLKEAKQAQIDAFWHLVEIHYVFSLHS